MFNVKTMFKATAIFLTITFFLTLGNVFLTPQSYRDDAMLLECYARTVEYGKEMYMCDYELPNGDIVESIEQRQTWMKNFGKIGDIFEVEVDNDKFASAMSRMLFTLIALCVLGIAFCINSLQKKPQG